MIFFIHLETTFISVSYKPYRLETIVSHFRFVSVPDLIQPIITRFAGALTYEMVSFFSLMLGRAYLEVYLSSMHPDKPPVVVNFIIYPLANRKRIYFFLKALCLGKRCCTQ